MWAYKFSTYLTISSYRHTYDQVADAQEDPTVCGQWLVRYRTSVGCSDPIAVSSQVALVEVHRMALAGLRV
jgi:hypothetical protein